MAAGYKGLSLIKSKITFRGFDEQVRKLEGFDALFNEIMPPAMDKVVRISAAHAKEDLAGKITGQSSGKLGASIQGRMLSPTKNAIRGSIFTGDDKLKTFALEVGRNYGNAGAGTVWRWQSETGKGYFFLWFGVKDKEKEIAQIFGVSQNYLVGRLVVK